MGAPFADAASGTVGDAAEGTGGSGCRPSKSLPVKTSESWLAILVGTEVRGGTRDGDCGLLARMSPYGPLDASSTAKELECGGI